MNHIACRPFGPWLVVTFECDRMTDPVALHYVERELNEALRDLPAGGRVVICLEGVEYVSSQFAGLLLGARKLVAERRGRLTLCRVGDHLAEMLRMTRLESHFEIKPRLRDVLGKDAPRARERREMVGSGATEWID